MSTASLPSYLAPLNPTPLYSTEPHEYEQRLALSDRLRPRPAGNFVKQSRNGDAKLRLTAQEDKVMLPVYGTGGHVEGTVELSKTDGVTGVEVKIEGRLKLKEVAEGGTTSVKLCLDTALLWTKDPANTLCPPSLRFSLTLPSTFTYEDKEFPLPPTFDVKLSGLPGFTATIDYSVTAFINKPNHIQPLVPQFRSKALGISIGTTIVATPFVYYPRSRPAFPIPPPLQLGPNGLFEDPNWSKYESLIRVTKRANKDILSKLYIPQSRIFCINQTIPFHLTLESSAVSLAAFLPYSPTANHVTGKKATRIEIVRQSSVDVRNSLVNGAKTDMWRVDSIGVGTFNLVGNGPSWISYTGEMKINNDVKVVGFRAAGLHIKDFVVLSMFPFDPLKSPFTELREVVPIRLTTDPWTADGTGIGASRFRAESGESVALPLTGEMEAETASLNTLL